MNPASFFAQSGSWEWRWFLGALAFVVLLRLALPAGRRRRLRSPLALLGIYLALLLCRWVAGAGSIGRSLGLVGAFVLALALVRLLFTALFDGLAVARDRVPKIVQDVLLGIAYFITLMGLFSASGVELSSILTTSALLTAVVGFALQDTLGNVIGGLAIQVQRPYSVGDWVSLDGKPENIGRVVELN